MTTDTRQVIQYVAMALFALFTLAMLAVFVFAAVTGHQQDPIVLGYLASIVATITVLIGVNSGANTNANATARASENMAAVVTAANGNAAPVTKAALGLSGTAAPPPPPTEPTQ